MDKIGDIGDKLTPTVYALTIVSADITKMHRSQLGNVPLHRLGDFDRL